MELFTIKLLEGDPGLWWTYLSYNYFSGEHITGFEEGRPLFVRTPESKFTSCKLYESIIYTPALGAMQTWA